MNLAFLLAENGTPGPDEAIGWAERLNKGGVPVISLVVAIAAVVGLIILFNKLLGKSDEFKDLERGYRGSIESKAQQDRIDAENRLREARADAENRATREMAMMKERLAAEKEGDATLAQAVHVIERNIQIIDKVDRRLDVIDGLSRKLDDIDGSLDALDILDNKLSAIENKLNVIDTMSRKLEDVADRIRRVDERRS